MAETRAETIEKVNLLIKDINIAMLTTIDRGVLRSRPMQTQEAEFDGTLWFFTGADTRKAREIAHTSRALLTYAEPGHQAYVSISGHARIVRDQAKIDEYWNDFNKAWFPEGKDDPNLVLIRFDAEDAEFWDAPGPVVTGLAYIKAFVAGERPHVGQVGKVNLSH